MTIIAIIIIGEIAMWIAVGLTAVFSQRKPNDTLNGYTGSLGQGKTLIGVGHSLKVLKKRRLLWALHLVKAKKMPLLYSNIPIRIKTGILLRMFILFFRGKDIPKWTKAETLKYEHITGLMEVVEYSVVFVDELGEFANQYSYDNPFVVQYIQRFIRFFRHWIDGVFNFTDQSSSNITKPIRSRVNVMHNLINFRRFLFHWYKVDVLDVMQTEDITTISSSQLDDPPYYFGYLPYKWFKFLDWTRLFSHKKYESRCYLPLYDFANVLDKDMDINGGLFTKYVISLPDNADMKRQFRKDGYISRKDMMQYVEQWQKHAVQSNIEETQ